MYDVGTKEDGSIVSDIQNQIGQGHRLVRNPRSQDRDDSQMQRRLRLWIRGSRGMMDFTEVQKK